MKNKNIPFLFMFVCLMASPFNWLKAQNNLDSMVVISVGEYQPTIIDANKIGGNPSIEDSTKKLPVSDYNINSTQINTTFEVEQIKPAKMVGEPLTKLYNSLVKLGMGTYTTPYAELWVNSLRSKNSSAGARLKHLSSTYTPKGFGFGGFSDNEISLYGKKFLNKHSLMGNFDYARNAVHLYGYDTQVYELSKDTTKQVFNLFSGNVEFKSHYTNRKQINHDVKLNYYNLSGPFNSAENNIKATGTVKTAIGKEDLEVNAMVDYYNYKTQFDTVDNTIISLNPNYISSGDRYSISLGFTAAMDVNIQSKFYFYPTVDFSYNVFENIIIPYAGARGGILKNSYKVLKDENPFVRSELKMKNSNTLYEVFGGIRGTLSATTSFNASVSYNNVENMAMFVNDTSELKNKFIVIYDDAQVLKIGGEIAYQLREKLRINLEGEYFNYKMKTETRAWYKPQVKISLSGNYNLKDKIIIKAGLFYIDKQFAKTYVADTTASSGSAVVSKELSGVFDANIGGEYRYNKKLGFFINLNNIANFRYMRWNNYPTQKFSLMAGLSYSF